MKWEAENRLLRCCPLHLPGHQGAGQEGGSLMTDWSRFTSPTHWFMSSCGYQVLWRPEGLGGDFRENCRGKWSSPAFSLFPLVVFLIPLFSSEPGALRTFSSQAVQALWERMKFGFAIGKGWKWFPWCRLTNSYASGHSCQSVSSKCWGCPC